MYSCWRSPFLRIDVTHLNLVPRYSRDLVLALRFSCVYISASYAFQATPRYLVGLVLTMLTVASEVEEVNPEPWAWAWAGALARAGQIIPSPRRVDATHCVRRGVLRCM